VKRSGPLGDVSRETYDRLEIFAALLLRWNRTVNLIARSDEALLWPRHIEDSLQLVPLMTPAPERAVDLGSGAGFPGLIVSIATSIPFDIIEADRRKAAFLREAIRVTGAPARVHAGRIEATLLPPAPLVTARALAPLPKLLRLAEPLLARNGVCLFLKGNTVEGELTTAAAEWHMKVERLASRTAPGASILRITELTRAPRTA
jgi:16S rRNA (guanine527-N7)-methyltransferase